MKVVVDRIVEYPNRYKLINAETGAELGIFDFVEETGLITQVGTAIDAELFESIKKDIEDKIGKENASDIVPLMDGEGNAGTSYKYSREDHKHPSDNTKANTNGVYPNMSVGKATYDENGNRIINTYVKNSGDTMTGNLTAPNIIGENGVYDGKERVYSPNNPPPSESGGGGGEPATPTSEGIVYGQTSANLSNATAALGYNARANGANSTAIGGNAQALLFQTVALGYNAVANKNNTISIGSLSYANAINAVALGSRTEASGGNAVALGTFSLANSTSAIALGYGTEATGRSAITIGALSIAEGANSIAIGVHATAGFANSVALGDFATVQESNSIVLGNANISYLKCAQTTITSLSDRRLKIEVGKVNTALCLNSVERIPLHKFYFINGVRDGNIDKTRLGFFAQEVEEVYPKNILTHKATSEYEAENLSADERQHLLKNGAQFYMKEVEIENAPTEYEDVITINDEGEEEIKQVEKPKPTEIKEFFSLEQVKELGFEQAIPTLWGAVQELTKKINSLERRIQELENKC